MTGYSRDQLLLQRRQTEALESIARSLEKLANPPREVWDDLRGASEVLLQRVDDDARRGKS
jgi:hypothetical protein